MTTELPPEMRAMNAAMDLVFNAVTKPKDVHASELCNLHGDQGVHLSTPEYEQLKAQTSKRQIDIESAIMTCPGFDYLLASEIFAALKRRLEQRYENMSIELEYRLKKLSEAFDLVS